MHLHFVVVHPMHSALYLPKPSAQLLPPYLNPDAYISCSWLIVVEIYGCIWKWRIYPSIIIHHHPSFVRQTHGDVPNKREVRCTKLWPPAGWTCPCASPVPRCPWSVTAETVCHSGPGQAASGHKQNLPLAQCATWHLWWHMSMSINGLNMVYLD